MSAPTFIDSHCHLDRLKTDPQYNNLGARIKHTRNSGVSHMLNVCIDLENWQDVINIAEGNENVYASVGVHPSEAGKNKLTIKDLTSRAQKEKVIAIGETGLDYHYGKDNKVKQQEFFRQHIRAAIKANLPLIIHSREAREDTITIMREENAGEISGVMHCFTENWQMAKQALDLGFYISFSGIITFKNAQDLREVAKKTPLERTLIETDAPYLAPEPYRGKPNEPLYVKFVAEKLAEIHGLSHEEIARHTYENFFDLFEKAA